MLAAPQDLNKYLDFLSTASSKEQLQDNKNSSSAITIEINKNEALIEQIEIISIPRS